MDDYLKNVMKDCDEANYLRKKNEILEEFFYEIQRQCRNSGKSSHLTIENVEQLIMEVKQELFELTKP